MMKKLSLYMLLFISSSLFCFAQNPFSGKWKTAKNKGGKTETIISIYKDADGKYYGKVEKLLLDPGALCTECKGDLKNKPIEGMVILNAMELSKGELINGTILDPSKGKVYYCKISYEKKKERLKMKGSLDKTGFLGRTQHWQKHKD